MRKPFLVIQLRPEDLTADSELAAIRKYGGLEASEVIRLRVEKSGIPRLGLERYAGIIVGGSPFDVSAPEASKSPAQKRVEEAFQKLFQRILPEDFPFLGCCSGNGLLGKYCGATISGRFGEPVGAVEVKLTKAGQQDPLLAGLPASFRALVGHKEACDAVPPGSVLLATGASCPVQMFRVGQNAYATQFHPEGDAEGFALRIGVYRHHGYFAPETADELVRQVGRESTPEAHRILRRFVDRFRQ